ncbi:MAG TPA: hypothetical protein DCY13_18520 [Verrucomicrobiales bacterium]|nr:hypothetical protein [Verrucomicrobiales bacterium]
MYCPQVWKPRLGVALVEVLCAIAMVFLLASVMVGHFNARAAAHQTQCLLNLKESSLAFRSYANDNRDRLPMVVPMALGGAREAAVRGDLARVFQSLSGELERPGHLICPADNREPASDLGSLGRENVSYFLGVDARKEKPDSMLLGDRNLWSNDRARLLTGTYVVGSPAEDVGWSDERHRRSGNVAFSDGSAGNVDPNELQRLLADAGGCHTRLLFPSSCSGNGVAR